MDLGSRKQVSAIATQGRYSSSDWTTRYRLLYSDTGRNWKPYHQDGNIWVSEQEMMSYFIFISWTLIGEWPTLFTVAVWWRGRGDNRVAFSEWRGEERNSSVVNSANTSLSAEAGSEGIGLLACLSPLVESDGMFFLPSVIRFSSTRSIFSDKKHTWINMIIACYILSVVTVYI